MGIRTPDIIVPRPTEIEVRNHILFNVGHSMRMEIILNALQIGRRDPQRPHDLLGEGNKLEWRVIQGFATENRPGIDHERHVQKALLRHRIQYHHVHWNTGNSEFNEDDMMAGAADAVCSRLENRPYQGGAHSEEKIRAIIEINPPVQREWLKRALAQILKLQLPDTRLITSLSLIPNFGVPHQTHEIIVERIRETLLILNSDHGYHLKGPR